MKRTLAILLLVALAMWAMKRYYAEAPVDELQWILGPTATLVTALTRVTFEWEPGQGYLSRERFFLIAKACAGINFMIAAFGMVACVLGRRARHVADEAFLRRRAGRRPSLDPRSDCPAGDGADGRTVRSGAR